MLTHKGECLQQREKRKFQVFLFIHKFLFVSQERGSSMLSHCVPQLACKSVDLLIGQLLISVDACISSSEGKASLHPVSDKKTLKYIELRQ